MAKIRYKIYMHDVKMGQSYPISIIKRNINELSAWLNDYVNKWNIVILKAHVVDEYGAIKKDVLFLPYELDEQKFAISYEQRLLWHVAHSYN